MIRSSHGAGERRAKLPRRRFVAAVAALIPALAGCEAGANAPTQQWHPPTNGAGTIVHGIDIRNVFVLGASLNSMYGSPPRRIRLPYLRSAKPGQLSE